MSYDPNSPQAHKGKLGEQIVKLILDDWGADVKRPDNASENSPTLIDFHATPKPGEQFHERLIEVKVRKAMPYAFGQCPCYTFPVAQIEAYKSYSDERGLDCELWIVDPDEGEIYIGSLGGNFSCIEEKCFIDGREFPFDMQTKRGLMRFYHREQFGVGYGYDLSEKYPDELAALRAIDEDDALDKQSLEHFSKQFPEIVRVGLRELNREFSGTQILNAIWALKGSGDGDNAFPILIDKLLNGNNSTVLAKMFLRQIRDELSTVKATETSTVKSTETSTKMSTKDLLVHFANVVGLSANDVVEAVLEMRQIRFDEQQDRLKALFGGTKHD